MAKKLHVAFVWHMHQPMYRDLTTGRYLMPWVRLHAQKDYLDMPALLLRYPNLRQTFNLVPSLIEQIVDYADHEAWDRPLELLAKPGPALTIEDRGYLLERGFDVNHAHMCAPYPRYAELARRRTEGAHLAAAVAIKRFSDQDFVDLAVWFNLAWFDPMWLREDAELARLVAKGREFDAHDRQALIAAIRATLRRVLPMYKQMAESGQIELTTTPYYHPILPLLCDSESARVARPELPLPTARYVAPEDAARQLEHGLAAFAQWFGHKPRGLWPSEQSVSPQVLGLIANAGLSWTLSDEGVLARTLGLSFSRAANGVPTEASALYQAYSVKTDSGPISMVFRDVVLSDLIGFTYAQMPAQAAADDLAQRLERIRKLLPDGESYVVTIALDGENCWESYANDGADFLDAFYDHVSRDPSLELVTVGGYLERHPPRRTLETIHAGSWIGADFTTWIGDPTKNLAWDMLARARATLLEHKAKLAGTPAWQQALTELDVASGSDWFWWYGVGHDSGQDALFDEQFRLHIRQLYAHIGVAAPADTHHPLEDTPLMSTVRGQLAPSLDGQLDPDEWGPALIYDPTAGQGAMHATARGIEAVRYGIGGEDLYLAVSFSRLFAAEPGDKLEILFFYPGQPRVTSLQTFTPREEGTAAYRFANAVRVDLERNTAQFRLAGEYDQWQAVLPLPEVARGTALELAVPLSLLEAPAGQALCFVVLLGRGEELLEIHPPQDPLTLVMPQLPVLV